jgi:hypothetical protein
MGSNHFIFKISKIFHSQGGNMKKLIWTIATLLMLLSLTPLTTAQAKTKFKDLDEKQYSWAIESINFMTSKGILTGYPDNTFKPQDSVTKAEFTTMLYKLFDAYRPNSTSYKPLTAYTDVPDSFWAYKEIMAIYDENFSDSAFGYEPGASLPSFQPDVQLTRYQMAQLLQTAFSKDLVNHDLDEASVCKAISSLKDVPHSSDTEGPCKLSSNATNSLSAQTIASMQLNGILTADANGNFRPSDTISRAETVTVLYRVLGNLNSSGKLSAYSTLTSTYKFTPAKITSDISSSAGDVFDSDGTITKDLKIEEIHSVVQTSGHEAMIIDIKSDVKVDLKVEYDGKVGFLRQEELPFTLPLNGIEEVKLDSQIRNTSDLKNVAEQIAVLSVHFK